MPNYLGLDGFRFGWVAAWIDDRGNHAFDYSPGLVRLLALPHARAMIDMPIGLKWNGYRICDLRARELVGPAVFLGARRDLWKFADMAAANRHYWECEGKGRGVSAQLWNIRDKIRDADEIMTPTRQTTIGEAHPELIFWNLAGRARLAKKTSAEAGSSASHSCSSAASCACRHGCLNDMAPASAATISSTPVPARSRRVTARSGSAGRRPIRGACGWRSIIEVVGVRGIGKKLQFI